MITDVNTDMHLWVTIILLSSLLLVAAGMKEENELLIRA